MTKTRRTPILGLTALLLAACSAAPGAIPTPTASEPAASASASPADPMPSAPPSSPDPTSDPTAEPTSPPDPEPEPTARPCPRPDEYGFATLSGDSDLYLDLEFESVTPIGGGEPFAVPVRWEARQPSFFLAGRETRVQPSYADYRPSDIVMTGLTVKLVMDDGSRHEAEARFEPSDDGANVAVVRVPDVSGWGTVRISLTWRDSCYEAVAKTSNRVLIDQPSEVADCAGGRSRAFDELAAAFDSPVQVGTLEAPLFPWLFNGKMASLAVIDPLPPYVAFNRESETMTVSPAATVTVANTNSNVELMVRDSSRIVAFERRPLLRWLEAGWIHGDQPEAKVVFRSDFVANADGTFSFVAPDAPGRYAVEAVFDYDAQCSYGAAGFVVGIDVE